MKTMKKNTRLLKSKRSSSTPSVKGHIRKVAATAKQKNGCVQAVVLNAPDSYHRVEIIIDKDAQDATKRFMVKLAKKGFVMSRSRNTAENYTQKKQRRDSIAVAEFAKTEIFRNILKLR
jgi:hypothetical protein